MNKIMAAHISEALTTLKMLRNRSIRRLVARLDQEFPDVYWRVYPTSIEGTIRIVVPPGGDLMLDPDVNVDTYGYTKRAPHTSRWFREGEQSFQVTLDTLTTQQFTEDEKDLLVTIGKLKTANHPYLTLTCEI